MAYDILGKSFKAQDVYSSYFKEENNNILIPKVGLRFGKAGIYIMESNFNILVKKFALLKLYT